MYVYIIIFRDFKYSLIFFLFNNYKYILDKNIIKKIR